MATRNFILERHTWVHRAKSILEFYDRLVRKRRDRPNRPVLSVLYPCIGKDCGLHQFGALQNGLHRFRELSRSAFRVNFHSITRENAFSKGECTDAEAIGGSVAFGENPSLLSELEKVSLASSDVIVVFTGPTGSELSRALIHALSPTRPLVPRITESVRSTRKYIPREPIRVLVRWDENRVSKEGLVSEGDGVTATMQDYDLLFRGNDLSEMSTMEVGARLEDALYGTRATAKINILEPETSSQHFVSKGPNGWQVARTDSSSSPSIFIRVGIEAFRLPDDGMWCLVVEVNFTCFRPTFELCT